MTVSGFKLLSPQVPTEAWRGPEEGGGESGTEGCAVARQKDYSLQGTCVCVLMDQGSRCGCVIHHQDWTESLGH